MSWVPGTPYDFIAEFTSLSESDRATLHGGVTAPEVTILTDRGSDTERFCRMLSEVQCTIPAVLPSHYPRDRLTGWRVTPLGLEALPELFEQSRHDGDTP